MNKTQSKGAKPFLSILIPTRNRANYLFFAVQSALNIQAEDIEILVSENHSSDHSKQVLDQFGDERLKVYAPSGPLAMHENWEFLLSKAQGEWIYFLGDDDAIMPHAVSHLKDVLSRYPRVEAIVSPRAYYFWDGVQDEYGDTALSISLSRREVWKDSKKMLSKCLAGREDYINLPQFYSGGFQRKTLINRIKRAQAGVYFKSVTPDAYSALMSVLYTFRYLEIGFPLAWVGSSPHSKSKNSVIPKDRREDFIGMHNDDRLSLNYALGEFEDITFTLCFYEAYISSMPIGKYDTVNQKMLRKIFFDTVYKFRKSGNSEAINRLSLELGFSVPGKFSLDYLCFGVRKYIDAYFSKRKTARRKLDEYRNSHGDWPVRVSSSSHETYPNILSFDRELVAIYERFKIAK